MCSGIILSGENIEEWVAQRQGERNGKKKTWTGNKVNEMSWFCENDQWT